MCEAVARCASLPAAYLRGNEAEGLQHRALLQAVASLADAAYRKHRDRRRNRPVKGAQSSPCSRPAAHSQYYQQTDDLRRHVRKLVAPIARRITHSSRQMSVKLCAERERGCSKAHTLLRRPTQVQCMSPLMARKGCKAVYALECSSLTSTPSLAPMPQSTPIRAIGSSMLARKSHQGC